MTEAQATELIMTMKNVSASLSWIALWLFLRLLKE
jgi:hypothetical protein